MNRFVHPGTGRPLLGKGTRKNVTPTGRLLDRPTQRERKDRPTSRPKHYSKCCLSCGEHFMANRRNAKTCSPRCRQALSRGVRKSMAEFDQADVKCDKNPPRSPSGKP